MRKIKKLVATLLAATMVLAMGVTAFAAESTTLTNAKFVRSTGKDLPLGMGTGVIVDNGATMDEDGNITVQLQSYTRKLIISYTGTITNAYYIDSEGNVDDTNLIDADGNLQIPAEYAAEAMPANGNGIHLKLTFSMKPSTPPGMKDTMEAYFTCDNFQ